MTNPNAVALSGRRVVVTGASGLVGRSLIPRLLEHGAEVVSVFRRRPEWFSAVSDDPRHIECQADLALDPLPDTTMESATDLVHMAAVLFASNAATLYRDNIRITAHVAETAAAAPSIERVVFTSSLAARGPGDAPADTRPVSDYGRAKASCEAILRAHLAKKAPLAVLRPSVVLSNHDARMLALLNLLRRFPSRVAPHLPRRFSAVVVDDLADAIVAALSVQPALDGVFDVQHDADVDMNVVLGRPIGRSSAFARSVVRGVSASTSLWSRLTKSTPFLTADKLSEARHEAWCGDPRDFSALTGWSAGTPPTQMVQDALRSGVFETGPSKALDDTE